MSLIAAVKSLGENPSAGDMATKDLKAHLIREERRGSIEEHQRKTSSYPASKHQRF